MSAKATFYALAIWAMLVSGFFMWYQGEQAAQAALYGVLIVIFNLWQTQRRYKMALLVAPTSPEQAVNIIYLAAVNRFVFTLLFFIIGMGWLGLMPVPMLVAFAVGQFSYVFAGQVPAAITTKTTDSELIKHLGSKQRG